MIVGDSSKRVSFKDIRIGGTFRFGATYYMRIPDCFNNFDSELRNVVNLKDGRFDHFDDTETVFEVQTKLIVL